LACKSKKWCRRPHLQGDQQRVPHGLSSDQ